MLKNPVEGYFVVSLDDLIFEVKGVVHPRDRIIAYVRYVPDAGGERRGYRKLCNLNERESYLKKYFPYYLWYSKAHERVLQSVPKNMVKSILNPIDYLNHMRKKKTKKTKLSDATIQLADQLTSITGIRTFNIGVTGSQLANVATESSDIDLIIYGVKSCRRFYDRIKEMFDFVPRLTRYSGETLDAHVKFRWENLAEYHSILREIENRKVLQGFFGSYQFFIRLVKKPSEVREDYGMLLTKMRKSCVIDCRVLDVTNSIFTPCEYIVESFDNPEIKRLVSYRGRFTEQVSSGSSVRAKGRLEDVTDTRTGESYQQVVLGEDSTDFLIPI